MGSGTSALTEEQIKEYKELTYLTRKEILEVYYKFRTLCPDETKIQNSRIPIKRVRTQLPELKVNPFSDRLCEIFSSAQDGKLSFEDILDMFSVLCPETPINTKAYYAFQVYDFNGDDVICEQDIKEAIRRLSRGSRVLRQNEINEIVEKIFQEADLDQDGYLSLQEFVHMILKTPDFSSSFTIQL